jgi:tight adherence protein C
MIEFFEPLFDPQFVVSLLVAVAAFATIWTLSMPYLERDKLNARLKVVATRREELRQKQREAFAKKSRGRPLRSTPVGFMKQTVDQLNLRKMMESESVKLKLAQAGFRGQGPVVTFLFFRVIMPMILFVAALIYLFAVNGHELEPAFRVAAAFGAAAAGFYLPNIFIENIIQRRHDSIMRAFPDALDLLLICIESGMSIEAAFNRVANEVGTESTELAEELGLTTAELSYLQERRQAYENLATRVGMPGVKAVCTSLIQAERYGTPLATAMRVMAGENRDMRMSAAEKKAAALPAKLTVPMIVFFLPVLFVVILGPAIINYTNSQ